MPRTNLKKVKEAIDAAADAAVKQLAAEREIDSAHIDKHIEASKAHLEKLLTEEKRLIEYIEQTRAEVNRAIDSMLRGVPELFAEMRKDEEERCASLAAHAADIKDDGEPAAVERMVVKKIAAQKP